MPFEDIVGNVWSEASDFLGSAGTPSSDAEVAKLLVPLHAAELVAAHQYRQHAIRYVGPNSKSVQAELRLHADEEDAHARLLEGLIDDLGGDLPASFASLPSLAFDEADSETSGKNEGLLRIDLKSEERAIEAYARAVALLRGTDWFDVAVVLAGILREEREHARDLRDLLA